MGAWAGLPDVMYPEPETSRAEALHRVIKHHGNIVRVNPADDNLFDQALRCALTLMMTGEVCTPPAGSDSALRYLRDRVNVRPGYVHLRRQAAEGSVGGNGGFGG